MAIGLFLSLHGSTYSMDMYSIVFLTVKTIVIFVVLCNHPSLAEKGYFWQITDLHYDPQYTVQGSLQKLCHMDSSSVANSTDKPGMFGDPKCDSPWSLVESAITAMKTIHSNPDFVLWTGDTAPHFNENPTDLYNLIKATTTLMNKTFPNSYLLPVLGNHDVSPSGQMPPNNDKGYYDDILNKCGWKDILTAAAIPTFQQGGFYSWMIRPGLTIIVLNTNLHFLYNNLTINMIDPAGMFDWLRKTLVHETSQGHKVMIVSHVPPGVYERLRFSPHMHPMYNPEYIGVIKAYHSTIGSQIFGHEHKDSFRIFYDDKNVPISVGLLAPAVNPWKNIFIPKDPPNNPGIRLVSYNRDTGDILDVYQYYLDLNAANKAGKADWKLEYQFTTTYGVSNLSPSSLHQLVQKFAGNGSKEFTNYFLYNAVSFSNASCDNDCKKNQLCAIQHVDYTNYNRCISTQDFSVPVKVPPKVPTPSPITALAVDTKVSDLPLSTIENSVTTRHHHHVRPVPQYMVCVIVSLGALVFILAIVVAILCCRKRMLYPQTRYLRVPNVSIN